MRIKDYIWLLPFLSFLGGYLLIRTMIRTTDVIMPSLLGKNINNALALLAQDTISVRLLSYKEDPDLPDGTVVRQIPMPGKKIKQRQTALLVLSKKSDTNKAPSLVGKTQEVMAAEIASTRYILKTYNVPSSYPAGRCIAQNPKQDQPVPHGAVVAYVAASQPKLVIWPNFIGKPLDQVIAFLASHNVEPHITQPAAATDAPIVTDQRPLPGSIISLDEGTPPIVQLHAS